MLNTNESTPYFIWDNSTRGDLLHYLETRCAHPRDQPTELFTLQTHQDELLIGDIFVRIYNEQPTFTLERPGHFINAIMDNVTSHIQKASSRASMCGLPPGSIAPDEGEVQEKLVPVVQALHHTLRNQKDVDGMMVNHLRTLFFVFEIVRNCDSYADRFI